MGVIKFIFQKIKPVGFLRAGLGAMFFYSGFTLIARPEFWYWAVKALPDFIEKAVEAVGLDTFLRVQGVVEFLVGLMLLAWFLPKKIVRFAAAIVSIEMFLIVIFVGIDSVTFRDLGLLGATLALVAFEMNEQ